MYPSSYDKSRESECHYAHAGERPRSEEYPDLIDITCIEYVHHGIWKISEIISSGDDPFRDFLTILDNAQCDIREKGIDIEGFHEGSI